MNKYWTLKLCIIALVGVALLWAIFKDNHPSCAEAGTCYPLSSGDVAVGSSYFNGSYWSGNMDHTGCVTDSVIYNPDKNPLANKDNIQVILNGWQFDDDENDGTHDHNISKMSVIPSVTTFDNTGKTIVNLYVCFRDDNGDDLYSYTVWYTLIGYNN